MKKYLATAVLVAALSPQVSSANSFYVFGDYGVSKTRDGFKSNGSANTTDQNVFNQIGLGYRYNEYLAFEGGYVNVGGRKFSLAPGSGFTAVSRTATDGSNVTANGSMQFNFKGLFAGVRGDYDLHGPWSLFGRAGIMAWDSEVELSDGGSINGNTVAAGTYDYDSGYSPYFAGGGELHLTPYLRANMQLSYYYFDHAGDPTGSTAISGGLLYEF